MPDADALRAAFVANREKVRTWFREWPVPEVRWPGLPDIPNPWILTPRDKAKWFKRLAPHMDRYGWLMEARPVAQGVSRVVADWRFAERHRFERLEVEFRSYADPPYLAEKLALAAHAAGLPGWQGEVDARDLYTWLLAGIDSRPMSDLVRGKQRIAFTRFEIFRAPTGDNEIATRLTMTWTDTTLDGEPLTPTGESPP
jgi:hypothetical protein